MKGIILSLLEEVDDNSLIKLDEILVEAFPTNGTYDVLNTRINLMSVENSVVGLNVIDNCSFFGSKSSGTNTFVPVGDYIEINSSGKFIYDDIEYFPFLKSLDVSKKIILKISRISDIKELGKIGNWGLDSAFFTAYNNDNIPVGVGYKPLLNSSSLVLMNNLVKLLGITLRIDYPKDLIDGKLQYIDIDVAPDSVSTIDFLNYKSVPYVNTLRVTDFKNNINMIIDLAKIALVKNINIQPAKEGSSLMFSGDENIKILLNNQLCFFVLGSFGSRLSSRDIDKLLKNFAKNIVSVSENKQLELWGNRTSESDSAVQTLKTKGFITFKINGINQLT